jgi:hypothetical protein
MACTIDEKATDTCSIQTVDFKQTPDGLIKVSTDAVLCNVTVTHSGS